MRSTGFQNLVIAAGVMAGLLVPALPALPAAGQAAGAAPGTVLFVDGALSACSDSGPGTQQQPFCTISAATDRAQPGQTVLVAPTNNASLTITRSGTPGDPITIEGDALLAGSTIEPRIGFP